MNPIGSVQGASVNQFRMPTRRFLFGRTIGTLYNEATECRHFHSLSIQAALSLNLASRDHLSSILHTSHTVSLSFEALDNEALLQKHGDHRIVYGHSQFAAEPSIVARHSLQ